MEILRINYSNGNVIENQIYSGTFGIDIHDQKASFRSYNSGEWVVLNLSDKIISMVTDIA